MTKKEIKEEIKDERNDTVNKKKKFCTNCGEELDENDKFCDSCGQEMKKKKTSTKKDTKDNEKVKTKKCPNCGASIKSFQTSCKYCQAEFSNQKVSNSLEEFTKGLEKIKSKPMPKYEGKESLLKKVIGKDFNETDEREEFENNFLEQKNEEIANYILNYPIPNSTEDLTEFMILASSNVDSKTESDEDIQRAWKSKMNQVYEKAKLSVNNEADLKKITEIYENKTKEIKSKKITNVLKVATGIVGCFALLGFLLNPVRTIIFLLVNVGIILTIYSVLIDKNVISESPKLKGETARKISYTSFIIALIIYIVSWILSNPLVSIGIILLVVAITIFIYNILVENNKIKSKYKFTKKTVYIICGLLVGISVVLFIANGIKGNDYNYDYELEEKEDIQDNQDNQDKKENEKESKTEITDYSVDYKTAEEFEKAINDGEKVKGKTVLFLVNDYKPDSALGINTWAGEHLNFISENELEVKKGYYVLGKVNKEPKKVLRSWKIEYEVLEIYKEKPSILENENKIEDETTIEEESNNQDDTVIMIVPNEDYIGTDYKVLKEELESYGVTNIVVEAVETEDTKYKNNSIKEFTINGERYESFDQFKKDDEFKIVYWKVQEKESVYYSTNTAESVKNGNAGVYAYISEGKFYDIYYIIDFDQKKVYYFLEGEDNEWCDELNIKSGNLKKGVIFTYNDGIDKWEEKFKFDGGNPEKGIWVSGRNQPFDGFIATNLERALKLKDKKDITNRS